MSYRQLVERVDVLRAQLGELGLARGQVAAFTGDHSPAACALLLALVAEGMVAVPMSHQPASRMDALLPIAEAQYLIDVEGAQPIVEHRRVTVTNPLTKGLIGQGHPGLVIFSSGSTGQPKAVLHDFTRVLERFRKPRRAMRVLSFLVLDHFGGVNTLLHTLAGGGAIVTVEDRAPATVCRAIERHRVELLPSTPTFLNMMLMAEAHRQFDLSSLALVTYGTEVMLETTLARLRAALPNVRLQQTYGLTETGVMRSLSPDPDSRWMRVGGDGFETKIVDGRLFVRSQFAMLGYLNAPSPFDADDWFDTQDRVEVDGDRLLVLGRDSDIINVGGEKVYPAEVEAVLLDLPNVKDAAVFAHKNPVMGNVVGARLVLHAPEPPATLRQRLRDFCGTRLARHKIPMTVELVAEIAVSDRFKKMRPA